jgi:hypothetical protein
VLIIPYSWGSQLDGNLHQHRAASSNNFLAPLPEKKKTSAMGVSHAHPLLCFKFCFTLFLLALFYPAKIRSPFNVLYFYCFMQYAFFLERQLF